MPVVNIAKDRLRKFFPGIKVDKVLEILPFVGLDIEGMEDNIIRVEYNPNRPDFSSDYGIARALRGLLEIETGMPKFKLAGKSKCIIKVDRQLKKIRPYVVALVAKNGRLDNETIKQLIVMQEDLHNGIGRRRKKTSIGIHNLDAVHFPLTYKTVDGSYSFVPLGETSSRSINEIIKESEIGRQYGPILQGLNRYPVIIDDTGTIISLPPIINGQTTKVDSQCHNLFVEVTATDSKAAEDTLAIIASTLYDAGFKIMTVTIRRQEDKDDRKITEETPTMDPKKITVSLDYINGILGLKLDIKQAITCIRKSRLDAKIIKNNNNKKTTTITCTVPRYRIDITHPIDIAEEVAIGYGIYNIEPTFPASNTAGEKNLLSNYFNAIRETMTGIAMIEVLNFSLTSKEIEYDSFQLTQRKEMLLSVDGSKSSEHEILRESLIPSLLEALSRNVHEEYPQKLFEIGKTFHQESTRESIIEPWNIGAVVAHGEAGYTEIKSIMQALLKTCFGKDVVTKATKNRYYIDGRCSEIVVDNKIIGTIGEITPLALENFKLRVPVTAFEINLSLLTGIH